MTVTYVRQDYSGDRRAVTITVSSDLGAGARFYWYRDGTYVGSTAEGERSFAVRQGDQERIDVLDSTSDSFDPVASAPAGYPARRTLEWTRTTSSDVDYYLVEQQKDGGSWTTLGRVPQRQEWSLRFTTGRLTDLSTYSWRVTPYDMAGNAGTAITYGPEKIVRRPDAPRFDVSYAAGTQRVTFSEAS